MGYQLLVKRVDQLQQLVMEQLEAMELHLVLSIGQGLHLQHNKLDIIEDRFADFRLDSLNMKQDLDYYQPSFLLKVILTILLLKFTFISLTKFSLSFLLRCPSLFNLWITFIVY